MQNIIIPYTKELKRLENCIESKGEQATFLCALQDQMKRTKQNIFKLESIQENKRKLSADLTYKINTLNDKLNASMEHSQQKKQSILFATMQRLKKNNQKRKKHKEETHQINESKQIEIQTSNVIMHSPKNEKKETVGLTIAPMKLAEPKQLNEEEFYKQLSLNMEAAVQRRSDRLQNIKLRLHAQDDEINKHIERSVKYKDQEEQEKLSSLYNKLLGVTQRKSVILPKKKKISKTVEKFPTSQRKSIWDEEELPKVRNSKSNKNTDKFQRVKQKVEQFKKEREEHVQQILEKHLQYSFRIKQNKELLDELSNTCQYYNFKIKEQYQ